MLELRQVAVSDIDVFFGHQLDPEARRMAASTAKDPADRSAFDARWARTLGDPSVALRTVVADGEVAGYVASFLREGTREVAYSLGREHWGRGIATAALSRFLGEIAERPLHARAVTDNVASVRVLEKCGFAVVGTGRFVSHARGGEVDELVFALRS